MTSPARRLLVRTLLLAVAVLPQLAAICVPSGAWEVAATPDGSLIIFDSARNLARSDDSADTWYATDSLPLNSTRMTQGTCLEDGRCFRVREDRLGVEESIDGTWRTAWEYPPDRVDFAGRQLPGPCGDGHGWLGLTGMMAGPEGGNWDVLVPAGADGMLGLSVDGEWTRGVYGTPASLGFAPTDLNLLPEGVAAGFAAVVLILLFGVLDFRRDSLKFLVAAIGFAVALVVWWVAQNSGVRTIPSLVGLASIPVAATLVACRILRCDVAELFLGGFLGAALGGGVIAVGMAHNSTSGAMVLVAVAALVTVFSGFGVRGQLRRTSVNPLRLLGVGVIAVGGAVLAFQPYQWWAAGEIANKHLADLIAVAVAIVGVLAARPVGRRTTRT